MNQREEFVLIKPSVGKYVISFAIKHSPTWDGRGLFLEASTDHQHPTEGQGLIPSGWFCVHRGSSSWLILAMQLLGRAKGST